MNNMSGVIEGTPILTPNGPVAVERLVPGDYVLSALWHGKMAAVTVRRVFVNRHIGPVRTLCTDSDQCLSVVPDHVLFVDVAEGAPADVWEQIGREVLTDEEFRKRLEARRLIDVCADPGPPGHSFERDYRTQRKTGTVWIRGYHYYTEQEGRTPEGYVINPAISFRSDPEIGAPPSKPRDKYRDFVCNFDTVWKATREAQQQRGLEDVRLDFDLGNWAILEDPVTTYTSLSANLLTPWHFVPTAEEHKVYDDLTDRVYDLMRIQSARVSDILDEDYTGRVYELCVNPLCNYLAAGIVVFGAREQE